MIERPFEFISCDKLAEIITLKENETFLILDVRPIDEFVSSKINSHHCINLPLEIFEDGCIASRSMEACLKPDERLEFRKRCGVNWIIIVDWTTNVNDTEEQNRVLRFLWNSVCQHDYTRLQQRHCVLEGGFQAFINCCPNLTTDAWYRRRETAGSDLKSSSDSGSSGASPWYSDIDKLSMSWKNAKISYRNPQVSTNNQRPSTMVTGTTGQKQEITVDNRPKTDLHNSMLKSSSGDNTHSEAGTNESYGTLDAARRITRIGQQLLEGGGNAAQFLPGEEKLSDEEAIAEATEQNYQENLKEQISLMTTIINACKDKLDEYMEHVKLNDDTEKVTRETNSLKFEYDNIKKQRDAAVNELERRQKVVAELKQRKFTEKPKISLSHNRDVLGNETIFGCYPRITNDDLYDPHVKEDNYSRDYQNPSERMLRYPTVWGKRVQKYMRERGHPGDRTQFLEDARNINFGTYEPDYKPNDNRSYKKSADFVRPPPSGRAAAGPGLTGLQNLGCTCYMNSTIQCLSNTNRLREYFVRNQYKADINITNPMGYKGQVARSFAGLLEELWSGKRESIFPNDFKQTVDIVAEMFRGHQQQDVQEFMAFLLDALHEDLNKVKVKEKIEEQNNENMYLQTAAERAWQNHLKNDNSVIVDIFQGQFLNKITCSVCRAESNVFDILMYLSLPLPGKEETKECNLDVCFKKFLVEELINWYCPKCKLKRDASKTLSIWKLPKILIIHLKRFAQQGMLHEKLETVVDFPFRLNPNDYVIGPKRTETLYDLYAVVNHYGRMGGGHYTARCKIGSTWYDYDDETVSQISQDSVKTNAGYILFYVSSST